MKRVETEFENGRMPAPPALGLLGIAQTLNDAHNFVRAAMDALGTLEHWLGQMKGDGHTPVSATTAAPPASGMPPTPRKTRIRRNPQVPPAEMARTILDVLSALPSPGELMTANHIGVCVAERLGVPMTSMPMPTHWQRLVGFYLVSSKRVTPFVTRRAHPTWTTQRGGPRYVFTLATPVVQTTPPGVIVPT